MSAVQPVLLPKLGVFYLVWDDQKHTYLGVFAHVWEDVQLQAHAVSVVR